MANNKVVFNGNTLIDISSDTVTPETLVSGATAHDKTGQPITGTVTPVTVHTGTAAPTADVGADGDIYLVTG